MTESETDELDPEVAELLAELDTRLSGPEAAKWKTAIARFVHKANPGPLELAAETFQVGGDTKQDLTAHLESTLDLAPEARDLILQPGFTISEQPRDVAIARLRISDIFEETPCLGEILDDQYMHGRGVVGCEPQDGPYFALSGLEIAPGESYCIVGEPSPASDGRTRVFVVGCDASGRRWLRADTRYVPDYTNPFRLHDNLIYRVEASGGEAQ